jgi:hypothetical protein
LLSNATCTARYTWVGNIFNLDKHEGFYCSAASNNINCVGSITVGLYSC